MAFDLGEHESDARLLARYAAGDQAAARALVALHGPRVYALARRLLGDAAEAEDVAQEALLRLWRIAPDWRPGEARISTWLYRVATNLATDRLRRRRGVGLDAAPEPADEAPAVLDGLAAGERVAAIRRAVADLPERQRLAIELRHFEELGNPEIAEIMETSVEAVESLLARGRRRLAAALAGERAALGFDG
ncbi:MAG: RNA polymerase sigma factor [Pseudomonadota bacterium]